MATFNDLRKIALSLPLSYEDLHFGGPAFRVNKRKFALRWRETGQTILKLPKDRLEARINLRPDRVQPIKVGMAFWADIALERFDRKELNTLVTVVNRRLENRGARISRGARAGWPPR